MIHLHGQLCYILRELRHVRCDLGSCLCQLRSVLRVGAAKNDAVARRVDPHRVFFFSRVVIVVKVHVDRLFERIPVDHAQVHVLVKGSFHLKLSLWMFLNELQHTLLAPAAPSTPAASPTATTTAFF